MDLTLMMLEATARAEAQREKHAQIEWACNSNDPRTALMVLIASRD